MKGTVITCLREIVIGAGGEATWQACLLAAGFEEFTVFNLAEDVADAKALALIQAVCTKLDLSLEQAGDAFGDHWVNAYAPRLYKQLYGRYPDARSFFSNINEMHARVTKHIADAKPPRFRLEWPTPSTLVMHYESHRGLIDVAVGMARAMGRFYGETLVVTKLSPKALRIVFA
jgi:Haem-NO-binding